MSNVNKGYFLDLMKGRRLSMRGLAKRMGMQHSQLSLTLSGQRKLALDEAAQLSDIFGVPIHEIVVNMGVGVRPVSGRRVSVMGFVGRDGVVTMNPPEAIERTDAPANMPDNCVAIQCRTADTPLSWMDGFVLFSKKPDTLDAEATGRFCLARIKNGPVVAATVKRGYREGTYNLSGPHQSENEILDWATPFVLARF